MHKEEKSIMFVVNPRSAGGRTMKRWKNTEIMLKSERVGATMLRIPARWLKPPRSLVRQ